MNLLDLFNCEQLMQSHSLLQLLAVFASLFLIYTYIYIYKRSGPSDWFFAPSFGVAALFRFILFFQGTESLEGNERIS